MDGEVECDVVGPVSEFFDDVEYEGGSVVVVFVVDSEVWVYSCFDEGGFYFRVEYSVEVVEYGVDGVCGGWFSAFGEVVMRG